MLDRIVKDIEGLSGNITSQLDDGRMISIEWSMPVLDGEVHRSDEFRSSEVAEWRDADSEWRPYQLFLADVLHWPTLLGRLEALAKAAVDRRLEDVEYLDPTLHPVDDSDTQGDSVELGDFESRLAGSAVSVDGSTKLYFVEGTAGAGKSLAMATAALNMTRRARQSDTAKAWGPAALFVSSEGHLLANIDTAISRVVEATPGISSSAARTLARNGMLVLFVDGLDELLGDASYRYAIETFNSWAVNLNGSGAIVASARSSYFATTYTNESAPTIDGRQVKIAPEIWRLDGLSDDQIKKVWAHHNDGAELDIRSLTDSALKALRIPFLCHAAAKEANSDEIDSDPAIRRSLIGAYLTRELDLLKVAGEPIITKDQLRLVLQEIADILLLSGDRKIPDEDLQIAATMAGIDDARAVNRLRVMCGLEVDADQDGPRFVFSHDLYFDYFQAQAVAANLEVNPARVKRLLSARALEPWAAAQLIEDMSVDSMSSWLAAPFPTESSVARVTRGNVLGELIRLDSAPAEAHDVEFADAVLTGWVGKLQGVYAGELALDDGCEIAIGRIRCLAVSSTDPIPIVVDDVQIDAIRCGSDYFLGEEAQQQIFGGRDAAERPAARHPVQVMLSELHRRKNRHPVVLEPDYQPNDPRLSWLDAEVWSTLLSAAQDSGVAELDRVQSRGQRNAYHVRFSKSYLELSDRSGGDPTVREFWELVDAAT